MEDYWWLLVFGVLVAVVILKPWDLTYGDPALDHESWWSFDLFGDNVGDGGD
jgi:hypothetical protein